MKNSFTLPITDEKHYGAESPDMDTQLFPSEKTLKFLKLFARNYQVEKSLPEGLQEMILG